jgi:hypothetical protein
VASCRGRRRSLQGLARGTPAQALPSTPRPTSTFTESASPDGHLWEIEES